MPECLNLKTCPFFTDKMANMPSTANLIKKSYCLDKYKDCARYIVKQKIGKCPPDLFPNQIDRIEKIIKENKIQKIG